MTLPTLPVESATQRKRFDRMSVSEQIRALAGIVGEMQKRMPQLEHKIEQMEAVARAVIQQELAPIHAVTGEAQKALEALMDEFPRVREVVNKATSNERCD